MKFGIFDHLDRPTIYDGGTPAPVSDMYEDRLKLCEAYDRLGFYAYFIAEHHSSPLGIAPSPSIFLSAVAQRTTEVVHEPAPPEAAAPPPETPASEPPAPQPETPASDAPEAEAPDSERVQP